jgi:hypothetical protein
MRKVLRVSVIPGGAVIRGERKAAMGSYALPALSDFVSHMRLHDLVHRTMAQRVVPPSIKIERVWPAAHLGRVSTARHKAPVTIRERAVVVLDGISADCETR